MQATRHLVAENECFGLPQEGSAEEARRGYEETRYFVGGTRDHRRG